MTWAAVWLYLRFTLSYRDVEELLAERGIEVTYESIRRWVLTFGPQIARRLRARRPRPHGRWHLDEVAVRIGGKLMYLWRAVDAEGEVLDVLLQAKRDARAVRKLIRKLLKRQGMVPKSGSRTRTRPMGCSSQPEADPSAAHPAQVRQRPSRMSARSGAPTRVQAARVQVSPISAAIPLDARGYLQSLHRPSSFYLSPHSSPPSSQGV